MNSKMSETCKHLMIGIVIIDLLVMIVGAIVAYNTTGNWLQFILGVIAGAVIAMILAKHMDYTIDNTLDLDADGATKYAKKMSAIRFLIMAATLLLALVFQKVFNPIGVLLGIMALKFSAYAQPVTSKYISKSK